MNSLRPAAYALVATVAFAGTAQAQAGLLSNIATVTINATKPTSLSVTINSGGTQTMANLTDNVTNNFSTPVNITTAWDINPSAASVSLVGYFSNPAQALANGTDYITSSLVKGKMSTGTPVAFTAFTQAAVGGAGQAGGSLLLFTTTITGVNKKSSRSDNLDLQIDLTGQTATAGLYSGTLNLRAVTQ